MIIQTFTSIEVENVPHIWAVELKECKKEMNLITPNFVFVYNSYSKNTVDYVEYILTDIKPEKVVEGVTGGISSDYIEVGFWKLKHKS